MQFKDHKSRRRHENQINDPFFSPAFWENCQKLFHWVFPLVHSGLQKTWILEVKAVRLGSCPIRFGEHKLWGKQKNKFYFFYRVENKLKNFLGNLMVYDSFPATERTWYITFSSSRLSMLGLFKNRCSTYFS